MCITLLPDMAFLKTNHEMFLWWFYHFKIKPTKKRLWPTHPAANYHYTSKSIISTLLAVNWKGADLYFCLWTFFVYTPCAAARIFLHWCDAWNTFDYILIGLIKQLMHIFPTFNFLFSFLEADFVSNEIGGWCWSHALRKKI